MDKWKPRTLEDKLIHKYSKEEGGILYLEVSVGNRGAGPWKKGSKVRRIDAVRVVSKDPPGQQVVPVRVHRGVRGGKRKSTKFDGSDTEVGVSRGGNDCICVRCRVNC